ncbi:MAG: hypothetical protein HW375_12 [Anaerolineales bacterium]|nr:hypothetical protein [Anaerolineales bacterium]
MSIAAGFVCDECRYRHEFMRDIGKTISVEPNKHDSDYQTCTGLLCRRCTYGESNREYRRAHPETACLSRCWSKRTIHAPAVPDRKATAS